MSNMPTSVAKASAKKTVTLPKIRLEYFGQAIFHRPASSGVYAAILHIDFARIGFNDITQQYAIDPTQRAARAKILLESVLFTFIEPNGAMRTTQAPHLVNFEGVVSFSKASVPAPTVSPLKDGFVVRWLVWQAC